MVEPCHFGPVPEAYTGKNDWNSGGAVLEIFAEENAQVAGACAHRSKGVNGTDHDWTKALRFELQGSCKLTPLTLIERK